MSEFPESWFRDGGAGNSPGTPGANPAGEPTIPPGGAFASGGVGAEPTVAASSPAYAPTAAGWAGAQPGAAPGSGSAWPEQPPLYGEPRGLPGRGGRFGGPGGGGWAGWRRRWLRPRWILLAVGVVIVAIIAATVGMYFYVNGKLVRQDILVNYTGRPAIGAGQNWLITGSDSRQGLTRKQELQYATGKLSAISGQRSDTILVLHMPSNGQRPVLVSIPRDSYVQIPGLGFSKINAAFDAGGPKLLAETVQNATGLYINHYMGIGFGGLVNVVNDIGGVRMCLPGPMVDPKAGLNLKAGCQTLDGGQALGYVRTRNFALSDLQRVQDQRLFLKALLSKMTSPSVYLNPFSAIPAATGSAGALTVDQSTSLYQLIRAAFALRNPETTTVPLSNLDFQTTNDGVAVVWNKTEALRLFSALRNDTPVPPSLLTGSKSIPTG